MNTQRLMVSASALALLAFGCGESESSTFSVVTSELAVGNVNCPYGGTKVELRVDGSTWEEQTKYVCREQGGGSHGSGEISVRTTTEPAGSNCPQGGSKVEVLLDGVVQPGQTTYICDNVLGDAAAVRVSPESSGANCNYGGYKIEIVQEGTVQEGRTVYACGPYPGASMTVQTSIEPPGENCEDGGVKIERLLSGVVQEGMELYSCATTTPPPDPSCPEGQAPDAAGSCIYVLDFVHIPEGSYLILHDVDGVGTGNQLPVSAFKIGQLPVTVGQYRKCLTAGACDTANVYSSLAIDCTLLPGAPNEADENMPMNCINRAGAQEFCTWVGGRLPTEGEWEYAAMHNGSAPQQTAYPWGNAAPTHCVTANYKIDGENEADYFCDANTPTATMMGPSAVNTYPSGNSPLGLVDMSGNVLQWTSSSSGGNGILKGGSWRLDANSLLIMSNKLAASPDTTAMGVEDESGGFGFRCVYDDK